MRDNSCYVFHKQLCMVLEDNKYKGNLENTDTGANKTYISNVIQMAGKCHNAEKNKARFVEMEKFCGVRLLLVCQFDC